VLNELRHGLANMSILAPQAMGARMILSYHFVFRSLGTMTHRSALETERNPQLSGIEEINAVPLPACALSGMDQAAAWVRRRRFSSAPCCFELSKAP
jgi:hypothetical protein